ASLPDQIAQVAKLLCGQLATGRPNHRTIAGGFSVASLADRLRLACRFRLSILVTLCGNGRVLCLALNDREASEDLDDLVMQGFVYRIEAVLPQLYRAVGSS